MALILSLARRARDSGTPAMEISIRVPKAGNVACQTGGLGWQETTSSEAPMISRPLIFGFLFQP
jgi:hypothetical protein